MASETVRISSISDAGPRVSDVIRSANADHVVSATVGAVSRDLQWIDVTISGPEEAVRDVVSLGSRMGVW